jgi:hypothetical protein
LSPSDWQLAHSTRDRFRLTAELGIGMESRVLAYVLGNELQRPERTVQRLVPVERAELFPSLVRHVLTPCGSAPAPVSCRSFEGPHQPPDRVCEGKEKRRNDQDSEKDGSGRPPPTVDGRWRWATA